DPGGLSHSDEVSVLVNGNRIPTANAGVDQSVGFGDAVTLHGHASSDPDGDALMYRWTQVSGDPVLLADEASVSASFTAPTQASDQVLEFEIEVMDGIGGVDTDRVVVSVHGTGVFDPVVS